MRGLTPEELRILQELIDDGDGTCGAKCEGPDAFYSEAEMYVVESLHAQGRMRPGRACTVDGELHNEVTAEGKEAVRLQKLVALIEGMA